MRVNVRVYKVYCFWAPERVSGHAKTNVTPDILSSYIYLEINDTVHVSDVGFEPNSLFNFSRVAIN